MPGNEIRRVITLAQDITLLGALGELVTIQIDLIGVNQSAELLKEVFNDSEDIGLYINNMILQRIMDHKNYDYQTIFEKIVELTGEYESIDSVTALLRISYLNTPVEITVQLLGNHQPPSLVQITDQSHYFDLVQLIQTRWQFARSRM